MNGNKVLLEFFTKRLRCRCGARHDVDLAFSPDGNMWIDPDVLGIGPQHAPQLSRFAGGWYLLINPATQQVMLNARAAAEVSADPLARREWLAYVEASIQEHKEVRANYESTREI